MNVHAYLNSKGFQYKMHGDEANFNCPFCNESERKFYINVNSGVFCCKHENKCGAKGSFWDFQKRLGDVPKRLEGDGSFLPVKKKIYIRPEPYPKSQNEAQMDFLHARGFTDAVIDQFKIGYKGGAIIFPYFKNGELVNLKYRGIKEKKFWREKDGEPALFNQDNCKDREYLLIVEGEFDAMAWKEYKYNAVSVPSGASDMSWIENDWDFLNTFKQIFICFDNDVAGQKYISQIVNRLGAWRCFNIILPFKDANECLVKKVTKETMEYCLLEAKGFDPAALLNAVTIETELIDKIKHPEKFEGIKTPWEGLDYLLKGWREKELTVWTGNSGAGKSTILNEVVINLSQKGHKIVMASMEMSPLNTLRWILMNFCKNGQLNAEDIKNNIQKFKNLWLVDAQGYITPEMIIDLFDFAGRKYGVTHFFIDSLMKIKLSTKDELNSQKEFINSLIDKIAVPYNAHVHLVAHPRKGLADKEKPDKVDVSGSINITNLAHNVLALWRPDEEFKKKNYTCPDAILTVKKNREWGREGPVKLLFNSVTKSFTEQCISEKG